MEEEKIDETIVDKEPITDDIEEEEGSIEKAAPPKRLRSEKQRKAFEKAQAALKAKQEKDRELKAASRKPRGRPKKVLEESHYRLLDTIGYYANNKLYKQSWLI